MFKVRNAKLTDANAIYNIWAAGWKYAYAKILSQEFLAHYVNDTIVEEHIKRFPKTLREETKKERFFLYCVVIIRLLVLFMVVCQVCKNTSATAN